MTTLEVVHLKFAKRTGEMFSHTHTQIPHKKKHKNPTQSNPNQDNLFLGISNHNFQ